MGNVKQVIIVRTVYPNTNGIGTRKLRSGKLIAQACHASMKFLCDVIMSSDYDNPLLLTGEQIKWMGGSFTKICLQVDSEQEILDLYDLAKKEGLTAEIITDNGLTEFNGVPTITCMAIGPHYEDKIDRITGHLKLY